MDDVEMITWTEHVPLSVGEDGREISAHDEERAYPVGEVPEGVTVPGDAVTTTVQRVQVNPAWDRSREYEPRTERPEWAAIGLLGQLRVRQGQPVGDRWIRLEEGVAPGVDLWLVR